MGSESFLSDHIGKRGPNSELYDPSVDVELYAWIGF